MSTFKDANTGKWKVRYRIGSKQFSKAGFATKREAEAYEAEQLRKIRTGTWTDPRASRVTVGDVFEDWLAAKQVSERTRYNYRKLWDKMIAPDWAAHQLRHVTPAGVQRWVADLALRYSSSSVRKAYTIMSQLLDWAVADERIASNPLKRARELSKGSLLPRRTIPHKKRFLNHEEVARLADCAGEHALMINVMAYTGVRFGEVSALQVQHVDLFRNRLLVRRAFTEVAGVHQEVPPKSGQPRDIPLPKQLREGLRQRIGQLAGEPEALLFPTPSGSPWYTSNWTQRVFKPAVKAAGLDGLTPYGLRHTYAALAIQAGANVKIIQKAMGHSDIRLTLETYGGLFPDDMDGLAEGLDAAVARARLA